jgi:arylsulfatase A-like enzyme
VRRARTVGLEHTLIALSADHGMPEMPEAVAEAGFPAGRLYPEDVVDRANRAARRRFGIEEVVRFFFRSYLYLDRERIRASGTDPDELEQEIAVALTSINGIALAVARSALPTLAGTDLVARVRRNTHPARSGDIYVVQEPYWFLYEKGPIAAMHGAPWRYDTYVPILFAGPGIDARTIHRRVHPVDVASTLSAYLGLKPPSSAAGTPLEEVLSR